MSEETKQLVGTQRIEALDYCDDVLRSKFSIITPEILCLNEMELEPFFVPKSFDFLFRKRFWEKIKEAKELGNTLVEPVDIYRNICTKSNFRYCILNPYRMAWILIPILDHKELIEEGFYAILKKTRDGIMKMDFNEKTAPTILKALQFFTDRHLGPMLQRMDINQKTLSMNVDAASTIRDALSADNLDSKFKELQSKMKDVKQIEAVNVEVSDE